MRVICDTCKERFDTEVRVICYKDGIEVHGFKCPHCGEQYVSHVLNEELRCMIAECAALSDKITNKSMRSYELGWKIREDDATKDEIEEHKLLQEEIPKLLEAYDKAKKENKEYHDRLKSRV